MSWFESATGLRLLDPGFLWLALLAPLACCLRLARGQPALRFAPGRFLRAPLPATWRTRLRLLVGALEVLGLLLLVLALARPVMRSPLPHTFEGIDIVLCLDTSSSMRHKDLDPARSRLEVARHAAAQFVAGRPNDRIGLVGFARYPDLRCPLTLDHEALGQVLAETALVESDGPEDATGIGAAVARAAQVLQGGSASSKVVVLLTDGEENVATAQAADEIAPLHAAQLCAALGIRVYAIAAGAGSPGRGGEPRAIDTSQIRRLAAQTGGRFFEARDAGAVAGVYDAIHDLEKAALDELRYRIEERFLPFVAAALLLLLLGHLLPGTLLPVVP
jgi:Ca-activated chloride channel family protein